MTQRIDLRNHVEIGECFEWSGFPYRLVGFEPYTRRDGRQSELAVTECHCASCGKPTVVKCSTVLTNTPSKRCRPCIARRKRARAAKRKMELAS